MLAALGPLTDIDVVVTGEQHAWSHRPAVFFINHQSTLIDFLVTTRVIRTDTMRRPCMRSAENSSPFTRARSPSTGT